MATKNERMTLLFDDLPSLERIYSRSQRRSKTHNRGCGKVRLSREQAKDVVRRASYFKAFNETNGLASGNRRECRIYACLSCGEGVWHTTSKGYRSLRQSVREVTNESAA
jgi:hypothetical protein